MSGSLRGNTVRCGAICANCFFIFDVAFDNQGDTAGNDFFGSFDDAKKSAGDGNTAFDAAFDTGAWGDAAAPGPAPAASEDQAEEVDKSGPATSQDAAEAGEDKGGDSPDSQRKERSRRRRAGGGSSRSSRPSNVESGMEGMNISGEGDKKSPAKQITSAAGCN